ncbi:MAG TPA: alpha/beta hydrolase [Solirubrobacteraceae bacterium]|nr:alpha/beta hydrolase [Solirubrobacteraceae bacterium]
MTVVSVGDIHLDYERTGAGPPLLLIMGMSGTALSWGEPFLAELRRDFDVIAYDHRGVGASTRLDGPITIREMADDAAGLLDALKIDSAHVLGISMGGMIAQELALAAPERIRTLALGCTYCGGPGSERPADEVLGRVERARASGDRELALRAFWEINVSPTFAADADAYQRFVANAMRRAVAVEVIARQAQAIAGHDTSQRLAQIALPTLVIHGTVDQLLPVHNGRMIAQLIPAAQLEIFDGVGHLFFWERPQRSAELMREHAGAYA